MPPSRFDYNIHYNDGSYLTYNLTKKEYDLLAGAIVDKAHVAVIPGVGILALSDIRAVVELKPEPKKKHDEGAYPELTAEEREYLAIMRTAWRDQEGDTVDGRH